MTLPTMSKTLSFAAAVFVVLALTGNSGAVAQSTAGDPTGGRAKTAMCAGCHEIPGWQTAFPEVYKVPRIAGQHQAYIVRALQAYKSGERSHPTMRAIAASLSDKDMADLAAYYAQGGVKTASQ